MNKTSIIQAVMIGLAVFSVVGSARALDAMCDVDLWGQMNRRARLHTQIDAVTVQNLVYKNDSVLEYSCFNSFLNVAVTADNMSFYFTPWYTDTIIRDGLINYLYVNFGHTFMGGRFPPGTAAPAAGAAYACQAMARVWATSRCLNFAQQEPYENFYDLNSFMTAEDLRRYPTPTCAAPADPVATFGEVPVAGTALASNIPADPAICGAAVPTGYVIDIPPDAGEGRPRRYNEFVCVNPTCYYVPTGLNTGNCEPN